MTYKSFFQSRIFIILIFFISVTIIYVNYSNLYAIIPILIGLITALLGIFLNRKYHYIAFLLLYFLLVFFSLKSQFLISKNIFTGYFVYFLPMFLIVDKSSCKICEASYNLAQHHNKKTIKNYFSLNFVDLYIYPLLLLLSLYCVYEVDENIANCFLFFFLSIFSYVLSILIQYSNLMEKNFFKLYSNTQKEENNLKIMYSDLINSQDEKIENAILSERNRISRDIHDSLGHLTSRGILQIDAMIVTEKDENKKEQLVELKNTLSDGMNEVRNSLHNFQNESIDLEAELTNMVNSFDFCSINFFYSVSSDLSLKEKYSIIYIVKESLTNIVKHSDADRAEINIIESKAKIYIKIFDNGNTVKNSSGGMGVFSIKKRVEELKGNIEISTENGYRMFISFDI